jgi:hypothetical protein
MTLKTLEKAVRSLQPEQQRQLLRDLPSLLHLSSEELLRLKAAERSFSFWNNPKDQIYDRL